MPSVKKIPNKIIASFLITFCRSEIKCTFVRFREAPQSCVEYTYITNSDFKSSMQLN